MGELGGSFMTVPCSHEENKNLLSMKFIQNSKKSDGSHLNQKVRSNMGFVKVKISWIQHFHCSEEHFHGLPMVAVFSLLGDQRYQTVSHCNC